MKGGGGGKKFPPFKGVSDPQFSQFVTPLPVNNDKSLREVAAGEEEIKCHNKLLDT